MSPFLLKIIVFYASYFFRLQSIIDATGAASYHGFLPQLVRNCIERMTQNELNPYPQPFATALFSFLYHLASYECGKNIAFSNIKVTQFDLLLV